MENAADMRLNEQSVVQKDIISTDNIRTIIKSGRRPERLTAHGDYDTDKSRLSSLVEERIEEDSKEGFDLSRAGFVVDLVKSVHDLWNPVKEDQFDPDKRRGTEEVYRSLGSKDAEYINQLLDVYGRYIDEEVIRSKNQHEYFRDVDHLNTIDMIKGWLIR